MVIEGYSGLSVDELVSKGRASFSEADLDGNGALSKNEVKKYVKRDTELRALFRIHEGWQRFWQMMDDADEGISLRVSQGTERFFDEGDFVSAIVKCCREEGLITQAQEERALAQSWFTDKKFPSPQKAPPSSQADPKVQRSKAQSPLQNNSQVQRSEVQSPQQDPHGERSEAQSPLQTQARQRAQATLSSSPQHSSEPAAEEYAQPLLAPSQQHNLQLSQHLQLSEHEQKKKKSMCEQCCGGCVIA
eukprot:TRINITY_DN5381_c0_g2_i1.p1 TRINITY_DN5381_c0_g2~~TRINITY_DN5381_c0_g2_i1.p1  ORF type:complete len:247 (-),score=70.40 TRINITY_DN5381_c0_g2_i1:779-1519(-)